MKKKKLQIADLLIDAGAKIEVTKILLKCSERPEIAEALGQTDKVTKIADAMQVTQETIEERDLVRRVKGEIRFGVGVGDLRFGLPGSSSTNGRGHTLWTNHSHAHTNHKSYAFSLHPRSRSGGSHAIEYRCVPGLLQDHLCADTTQSRPGRRR